MNRSLHLLCLIILVCGGAYYGIPAYAQSTVRFQLEIVPVDDEDDDDDKDKDKETEEEKKAEVGSKTPVEPPQQDESFIGIVKRIIPETLVAASPGAQEDQWCTLTISRDVTSFLFLNILLLCGLILWIIGLWRFLPERPVCISGRDHIRLG